MAWKKRTVPEQDVPREQPAERRRGAVGRRGRSQHGGEERGVVGGAARAEEEREHAEPFDRRVRVTDQGAELGAVEARCRFEDVGVCCAGELEEGVGGDRRVWVVEVAEEERELLRRVRVGRGRCALRVLDQRGGGAQPVGRVEGAVHHVAVDEVVGRGVADDRQVLRECQHGAAAARRVVLQHGGDVELGGAAVRGRVEARVLELPGEHDLRTGVVESERLSPAQPAVAERAGGGAVGGEEQGGDGGGPDQRHDGPPWRNWNAW